MGKGFYHVELETPDSVAKLLEHSPVDERGGRAFMMPWKQGFNPMDAILKGDRIIPITIVFLGLRKEYFPMIPAIAPRIGTLVKSQETMAARLSRMSGLPSARMLVRSLENLPTKVILPNGEGPSIEQKIEFAGLPGQCFYCRQMGHLSKDYSKRRNKARGERRWCTYCEQEGHDIDKCLKKLDNETLVARKQTEKGKDVWTPVKPSHAYKLHKEPSQEACLTHNVFSVLDVEAEMQD